MEIQDASKKEQVRAITNLDPTKGHEQRGIRPGVVVSDLEVSADQRFPMMCIVPVTSTPGEGALYPRIASGASGLKRESYALVNQLQAISKSRVRRIYSRIDPIELEAIDRGLFLGPPSSARGHHLLSCSPDVTRFVYAANERLLFGAGWVASPRNI